MRLQSEQSIVALLAIRHPEDFVLVATENGYGKRTTVSAYRKTARGSQGVLAIAASARNGKVIGAECISDQSDILLMTDQGMLVRTYAKEVRETGRTAQGVKLLNVSDNEKLIAIQLVEEIIESDDDNAAS